MRHPLTDQEFLLIRYRLLEIEKQIESAPLTDPALLNRLEQELLDYMNLLEADYRASLCEEFAFVS